MSNGRKRFWRCDWRKQEDSALLLLGGEDPALRLTGGQDLASHQRKEEAQAPRPAEGDSSVMFSGRRLQRRIGREERSRRRSWREERLRGRDQREGAPASRLV